MPRKKMIMFGMAVGSFAGGYVPSLFGIDGFSMICLMGSFIGSILGIWMTYKLI